MIGLTTMRLRFARSAAFARTGKPVTSTRARLNGVEAGRGVAALLVVFYHSALHVEGNVGGSVLWRLPHFGHAGVDFFFVLSGFIITFVHHQDVGTPNRLAHYVQRRFTRVLPFYWVVLAYYLADIWLLHPARAPGSWELFSNVLLLPQAADQIVGGAWTLVYELMFYTIFAVMVCSRRFGIAVLALWALLIAAGLAVHPALASIAPVQVASSPFCFEFFLGMGAAYFLLRRRVPRSGILLLAGMIGFLVAGVAEARGLLYGFGSLARLVYGGCSVVIIAALVERERSGLLSVPKPLAVLGRASYSVYLVHLVGLGIAYHFIARFSQPTVAWSLPIWLLLCAVGVAAGVLASIWVEQPLIRQSRRWVDGWVAWAR
jgi:exopolysaccharide production protein ExoZ